MKNATVVSAHPNIALVKYWGKRDAALNLPAAGSLSLTLAGIETRTAVAFRPELDADRIVLNGRPVDTGEKGARVTAFLDRVRAMAGIDTFADVASDNTFPTGAGLASSASAFAALALATTRAAGLELAPRELSVLARIGSGSAARSIYGGFVEMKPGVRGDGTDAFAVPVASEEHWDLRCLIAVTAEGEKAIGSTVGMNETMRTSPYYPQWIESVAPDIEAARAAVLGRDFELLATVAERSCLRMHASAIAADPGILYWNGATVELIHRVRAARAAGTPMFFTIDAGPHVKVFCPAGDAGRCEAILREVEGVRDVIATRPGPGARVLATAG